VTTENPFSPGCSRQSFLETIGAGEVLRRLEEGLGEREPFLVLTGEPGTGKTVLANEALARWESRVAAAFLAYPAASGAELLEEIVLRLGGQPAEGASPPRLRASLEHTLAELGQKGRIAMVVVDDAHRLSTDSLEALRLLVNTAQQAGQRLEVLLVGLPALATALDDSELAALRERVSVRAELDPLSTGETRRYVRHRLAAAGKDGGDLFPRRTCLEIATLTGGVPRRINALASAAMRLAAVVGDPAVEPEHVQAAAEGLNGPPPTRAVLELDDEDRADEPSMPPAKAAKPAPAPTASPTPKVTKPAEPAHAPTPAPAAPPPPPPQSVSPVPTPVVAREPEIEARATPLVPPPTRHDRGEWIARFVGDKGPVQIGSRAAAAKMEWRERGEPRGEEGAGPKASPRHEDTGARPLRVAVPGPRATTIALAALVGIGALALIIRAGCHAFGRTGAPAVATSLQAPADGTGDSLATTPAGKAKTTSGEAPSSSRISSPTGRYTIEVGGSSDFQSAIEERDRLQLLTGIQGWVIPAEGGQGINRVVLGIYSVQSRAQAAANMLVRSRTLRKAAVVAMPKASARL